ncbi:hypothetical protein LSAT2_007514 [Lamellibrachia satsuma]|nr:hypothetical protein LSAT2_007514 [Lamellibrachia satsuma]
MSSSTGTSLVSLTGASRDRERCVSKWSPGRRRLVHWKTQTRTRTARLVPYISGRPVQSSQSTLRLPPQLIQPITNQGKPPPAGYDRFEALLTASIYALRSVYTVIMAF